MRPITIIRAAEGRGRRSVRLGATGKVMSPHRCSGLQEGFSMTGLGMVAFSTFSGFNGEGIVRGGDGRQRLGRTIRRKKMSGINMPERASQNQASRSAKKSDTPIGVTCERQLFVT